MTNRDLKTALLTEAPVMYGEAEYKYVSAVIYRKDPERGIRIDAELMDKCERSVLIVPSGQVRFSNREGK